MSKSPLVKCLVLGIVVFSAAFADRLNAESSVGALQQELPTNRAERETFPHRLSQHKEMELARILLAERGYNSTNKPSREVLNEILVEAGVIRPNSGSKSPSRTVSLSPTSTMSSQQNGMTAKDGGKKGELGAAFWIFLVLVLLSGGVALGGRMASGKDVAGQFSAYQERVDRCLLTDRALRNVVTQRMLEEWALIIRFFSSGDEPRRLCVPTVLFLWEKIFEPEMSHDEVIDLDKRIRKACGLDKVFSRKNFESISAEVIKESGYEPAWRNWQQLGDYAYSASDRIGGGQNLKRQLVLGHLFIDCLRIGTGNLIML